MHKNAWVRWMLLIPSLTNLLPGSFHDPRASGDWVVHDNL